VIHSHARTTYTQVWETLQHPTGPVAKQFAAVVPQINHLHQLFLLLQSARKKRGSIDFDTVETKIICNDLGRIEKIIGMVRNDAHRMIEECMLTANTCAADFLLRSKHHGLFRVHEGPTPEKLKTLKAFLKTLGLSLGGGDDPQGKDYAVLIDHVRARPDFGLLQSMSLRSMQQAIYSPDNMGHFGLSYPAYAHFTSPIRRFPDLLTHRAIKALLANKRYTPEASDHLVVPGMTRREYEHDVWEKLGIILSARERRADDASRDVEAWLKCWFVKERVGEVFSGRVTGVASFGIFVTLDTLHVEGMVHVSELGTEYFQFNEGMHELRGERTGMRYRLTDSVQVQVARVDLEARRIEFRLVDGTSFTGLRKAAKRASNETRHVKKAAAPKPAELRGQTTKQRRAQAKRASTTATASAAGHSVKKATKAPKAATRPAPIKKR